VLVALGVALADWLRLAEDGHEIVGGGLALAVKGRRAATPVLQPPLAKIPTG
jgi:hypothetical protein